MTEIAKLLRRWFTFRNATMPEVAAIILRDRAQNNPAYAELLSALLALADSTEAARDERYPASNWKVTQ